MEPVTILLIVGVIVALFLLDLLLAGGGSMTTLAPRLRAAQVQVWA